MRSARWSRWERCSRCSACCSPRASGRSLVRRQLQPLREVAATATGGRAAAGRGRRRARRRVPDHLTDEQTEVGQVGAALNTLLAHVEASLDARHRSEQQVRQFVADASHELRTPLTTIAGYTELARTRPDDREATATALAKVEEEAARMTALVEDLLLLARLDSGRPLDARAGRPDPPAARGGLRRPGARARTTTGGSTCPTRPIEVVGDEQRLHQVVTNLLTNARKYTPARHDGHRHRAGPAGSTVHDDGPGFPPDLRRRRLRAVRPRRRVPAPRARRGRRRSRPVAGRGDRRRPRRHASRCASAPGDTADRRLGSVRFSPDCLTIWEQTRGGAT